MSLDKQIVETFQHYKERDFFNSLSVVVFFEDGQMISSLGGVDLEDAHSRVALMAGAWEASVALNGDEFYSDEQVLSLADSQSGFLILPLRTYKKLRIGVVYKNVINPGKLKMKSKLLRDFLSDNLVKTAVDSRLYEKVIIDHFKATHKGEHVLIVGDEKLNSKLKMLDFAKQIQDNDSLNKIQFLQPENGYIDKERFVAVADTMAVNWVLLTTNSKVVTADVVNNLKALPNNPKVKFFAFEKGHQF